MSFFAGSLARLMTPTVGSGLRVNNSPMGVPPLTVTGNHVPMPDPSRGIRRG